MRSQVMMPNEAGESADDGGELALFAPERGEDEREQTGTGDDAAQEGKGELARRSAMALTSKWGGKGSPAHVCRLVEGQ